MSGTLYLCATPIGNLEDITFRVINTLKEVDLIAAEVTRHSIKLLNHFEIKTKMTSYHEYNRVEKAKVLVKQLQEGKDIQQGTTYTKAHRVQMKCKVTLFLWTKTHCSKEPFDFTILNP